MISRDTMVLNISLGVLILSFSSVNILCYCKICLHTKQIEKQTSKQTKLSTGDKMRKPRAESKVARVTGMIMGSVLICYTPQFVCSFYELFPGEKSPESHYFLYWAWLFALVNSFINPFITCLQLSVIRKAVLSRIRL